MVSIQIIFTANEADFVQNLIFIIGRTYRTADFGVWEEGSRYANTAELNATSIAMAKAALEAANGLPLLGRKDHVSSVLYSDPDAHYRIASTLNRLLPRESFSKETDAYLLAVIGFPAFSIDSLKLRSKTLNVIESSLKGVKGYKRYPLDALGVPAYYLGKDGKPLDINSLEGVEAEWPIFYAYQAINAMFTNDHEALITLIPKIKSLLITNLKGYKLLPMYYRLSDANVDSLAHRTPFPENKVFLWGQALYIIYLLLKSNLIKCTTLDPLQRHLLRKESFKPLHLTKRYSTYRV